MTTLSLTFLLGICGLAIDIGRMYIAKNEAQAYVDSAALAAARQLDGTPPGITNAANAASTDTGKWRFDTLPFTNVSTGFATSASGPFTTSPVDPTNYKYVQVVATVNVPMYLIRILVGPSATVAASAVAGTVSMTTISSGIFPFSPYTRTWTGLSFKATPEHPEWGIAQPDKTDDPFGYQPGYQYTLRWGAPGDRTDCGTDHTKTNLSDNGDVRGYCCVSNSAAELRQAIVGGKTDLVTIGQNVPMDHGAKNTEMSAIGMRVAMDSDTTSTTYAQYKANGTGNGARVVVVVVNGGEPNYIAMGFASFFLLNSDYYNPLGGNDSACAEYIGAWTEGQTFPGTGSDTSGSGVAYHLKLLK
jgi:hypothetical protein